MRVLKFIFSSNFNLLAQKLVDYLIDSGHFVYIDATSIEDVAKWKEKYKYNLYIIDGSTSLQHADYVVDFSDSATSYNLAKIKFDLELTPKNFSVLVLLEEKLGVAQVCQITKEAPPLSSSLMQNLSYLINEIVESFIDAVVYLLRFDKNELVFTHQGAERDAVIHLIHYKQLLRELKAHYARLADKEKGFFVQNLLPPTASSDIGYLKLVVGLNGKVLNQNDLEALILYLMTLLNSRQDSIYSYDICFHPKECPSITKKVSKFIDVGLLDSYSTLSKKLNDDVYALVDSTFYYGDPLQGHDIKPKVLVLYDCEHEANNEYAIVLAYKNIGNELYIRYREELYFFGHVQFYIDNFVNKFESFSSHGIEFRELLSLPKSYLKSSVYDWNKTDQPYPSDKTIHGIFEDQVAKAPGNVAVVYKGTSLTYKDLNERANQLAHYLHQISDIKPDTLIALFLDRSEHTLIAILAILKAGGAYVPISADYPDNRVKYILDDTGVRLILTNEKYQKRLASIGNNGAITISLDTEELQRELNICHKFNPTTTTSSTHLSYIIYTSGTTGNPKGVMIEHTGVVNLSFIKGRSCDLDNTKKIQRCLWYANYVFDTHVSDVYTCILYGHTLHIIGDDSRRDIKLLSSYVKEHEITLATIPPALLNDEEILALNTLIVAGEKTDKRVLDSYLRHNIKVINEYGPTEITVCSSLNHYKNNGATNIGKPLANVKYYVLDDRLQPLPVGAIGELYIGGVGVARGYLNRPELTAERFIKNPFQSPEEKKQNRNARLYKTGDLVRWLPNGDMEYIGRNDFQVKIRGFRVELGEIENVLSSYKGIKQSIALVKEYAGIAGRPAGNKYLVGYYIADIKLDEKAILAYLQSKLPDYMVPNALAHLEKLPLTINGKLDRKALPEPALTSEETYVPPRNALEAKICKIWAKILGLPEDNVGIDDDFFKLGGDSITGIQLAVKLRQKLGVNIQINDIFNFKNVGALHDNILNKEAKTTSSSLLASEDRKDTELTLLPIQEWFFENDRIKGRIQSNQSFIVRTPVLDTENLRKSIKKMAECHDALRFRYKKVKDGTCKKFSQYNNTNIGEEGLRVLDIRTLKAMEGTADFEYRLQDILSAWQEELNIEKGPTYTIGYIYGYNDGSARIYFALHYLVSDRIGWRILMEDLRNLYNGNALEDNEISYKRWVRLVHEYSNNNNNEEEYWNGILADHEETSKPLNKLTASLNISCHNITLNQEQTHLLQEINKAYNTQIIDILLSALAYILVDITGSSVNHIVLKGDGRSGVVSDAELTRTVGRFTMFYPIRLNIKEDLASSIKSIKEDLRQVPNNGIGYGILIGYRSNLPKVSFSYSDQYPKKESNNWYIENEKSEIPIYAINGDQCLINIRTSVTNGELRLDIESKLWDASTDKIAEIFKQKLEEIINYIGTQERSYLTVSDISNVIQQEYLDKLQKDKDIEDIYLANSSQQAYISHALNHKHIDDTHIVQIIKKHNGVIIVDKLKEAWSYAQEKYPALRLRFGWEKEVVQVIDKKGHIEWQYLDFSQKMPEVQEEKIRQIQQGDRAKPYYLTVGSLFRIYLIKQKEDLYTFIFSNHHSILDGWSYPILLNYVNETYAKLLDNKAINISADGSYKQAQKYLQERLSDNQEYWKNHVSDVKGRNSFTMSIVGKEVRIDEQKDMNSPKSKYLKCIEHPGEEVLIIKGKLYDNLRKLGIEKGFTMNAVLQYVWHNMLHVYGNKAQTAVATVVSGRNLPVDELNESVGLYINTLPLVVTHDDSKDIFESIKALQQNIIEINARSNIDLLSFLEENKLLLATEFVYENFPGAVQMFSDKSQFRTELLGKIDSSLAIYVYEEKTAITCKIGYDADLFDISMVRDLSSFLISTLEKIVLSGCPTEQVTKALATSVR